jgi:EpsI family protein
VAKPSARLADERGGVSFESIVPKQFGDWREEPQRQAQIVNPQTQELLDKLYSEVVTRVYVNSAGYRIMLSLAYGSDQRGMLQAHKPEVCYPAQGFTVEKNVAIVLVTPYGEIPARRLSTVMRTRHEPVTYWLTVGDRAVAGTVQKRLVELRFGLSGRIPDGLLFRVSSIDAEPGRAYGYHDQFINDLLESLSLSYRKRLSGLGDA